MALLSSLSVFGFDGDLDTFFYTGPGFDDEVLDIARLDDGRQIIVGKFRSAVGAPLRKIAKLMPDGAFDTSFKSGLGADGDIYSVSVQSDGKILIGGAFTSYDGYVANRVARLNPDGSFDPTFRSGSGADGTVFVLQRQDDGKILVGGYFSSFDSTSASSLVRLSVDGEIDSTFLVPPSFSFSAGILAIAIQGTKIIIGGGFATPIMTRSIARLNQDGSIDPSFAVSANFGASVRSIVVQGSFVYFGGDFSSISGVANLALARVTVSGAVDTSFVNTSSINDALKIAVQPDGKLLCAGNRRVVRLLSNGSPDPAFVYLGFGGAVTSVMAMPNGQVLIGGRISVNSAPLAGANPAGVLRLNSDGSRDTNYVTRSGAIEFYVTKMRLTPSGKIVIFGPFASVAGVPRSGFAMLNSDGTLDSTFAPEIRANAAVAQSDGKLVVSGTFTSSTNYFRRLLDDGSIDPTFTADSGSSSSSSSNVEDLAIQPDGKIIAVGSFTTINGEPRTGIVRLNTDGSIDPTYTPNVVGSSASIKRIILLPDGKALIAGQFAGSQSVPNVVFRLNSNGIADPNFVYTQSNGAIMEMSVDRSGRIVVGGAFTDVNGHVARYVARINANGGPDSTFVPPAITGNGVVVRTVLAQPSGKIVFGGEFLSVGGIARTGLARLNPNGSLDTGFNHVLGGPPTPNLHSSLQQPDGKFIIGGNFRSAGSTVRDYLSRFEYNPTSTLADFDGDRQTDISVFRPSVGEWWYLRSSDNENRAFQFGNPESLILPCDFTGDGRTDIAFWAPDTGTWFVLRSEDSTYYSLPFGLTGDRPSPADFDGDGRSDPAVFRPDTGTWFVLNSASGSVTVTPFGTASDLPTVSDYDGDGKADIAIYRPAVGQWWIRKSSNKNTYAVTFGGPTDKPVQGDYTGDGNSDIAIWRESTGEWFVLRSENSTYFAIRFGSSGDRAVPGDYDGDGKVDAAVFRPSNSTWYINRSTNGLQITSFGIAGDRPVPESPFP